MGMAIYLGLVSGGLVAAFVAAVVLRGVRLI
ncbi:MAG: cytochrome B6 [Synechococcus sp.]